MSCARVYVWRDVYVGVCLIYSFDQCFIFFNVLYRTPLALPCSSRCQVHYRCPLLLSLLTSLFSQ